MPQQINLRAPVLLAKKRYLSAATILQASCAFLLLGGTLCGYWVVSLHAASAALNRTLDQQASELAVLQTSALANKATTGADAAPMEQSLQAARAAMAQRQAVLQELQAGLLNGGPGHAARLQLVASTIPTMVWVTDVVADAKRLDVKGFTLEPSELNVWVAKLAVSPLLAGQQLATVSVEKVQSGDVNSRDAKNTLPLEKAIALHKPLWSFRLVNAVTGGKP